MNLMMLLEMAAGAFGERVAFQNGDDKLTYQQLFDASGALAALVSLLVDAPVWVASARGAGTALVVLIVVRMASQAFERQADGARARTQNDG